MPTLTLTEFKITPLDAPLGAVVTGLDASQPVSPKVILQTEASFARSPNFDLQRTKVI